MEGLKKNGGLKMPIISKLTCFRTFGKLQLLSFFVPCTVLCGNKYLANCMRNIQSINRINIVFIVFLPKSRLCQSCAKYLFILPFLISMAIHTAKFVQQ